MVMQNRLYLYWNRERVMRNVLTIYLNRGRVMRNGMTFFLIRKMVMKNDIFGISVGAYCIRPLRMSPKGIYDQKCRYIWGVFNTPLPWRKKRAIPKINLGLWEIVWSFFDLKNGHAELIVPLFGSKKDHDKRHIGYFYRGVLHTPP